MIASSFVHLWNPVGYPTIHVDEGTYMRRAMHLLEGLGPKEELWGYDHPYFGPIFLSTALFIVGYPDISNPDLSNKDSFRSLYMVPRLLMGILAIIDTYLVYKIGEIRYGRKIALIAATLAVMPFTWLLRGVYLESILLPFLLASILFASKPRNDKLEIQIGHRLSRLFTYRRNRPRILQLYTPNIIISAFFWALPFSQKLP
jgi:hypothetical protein